MTRPEDPEDENSQTPEPQDNFNEAVDFDASVSDIAASVEEDGFTPLNRSELDVEPTQSVPPSPAPADDLPAASRPTRRRRNRSFIIRPSEDEIDGRLDSIARRATPTFDFFAFALLSGALLGIGYIIDAPAILLFGLLAAPILAPWIGAILGIAVGETRFFGQAMGGLLTATAMIFVTGILAGLASRIFMPLTFNEAFFHARLWWPDILLTLIGTAIITISLIQSEEKPILASLMVAYGLFLPISVAGFGLGNGVSGLWPQAFFVFLVHLSASMLLGLAIFMYMGFRPISTSGYIGAGIAAVICLALLVGIAGFGTLLSNRMTPAATPELTPEALPSPTTGGLPTPSLQPSPTRLVLTPTAIASPTPSPQPTPAYGRVQSPGNGAVIRSTPGGTAITTVENGYLVEIQPVPPEIVNGVAWIRVLVQTPSRDIDGWMQQSLIATATPAP